MHQYGLTLQVSTGAAAGQEITPALVTQLLAGVDPALSIDITPALESQLLAGVAPQVDLNLAPALESQLLAGVAPAITTGNVNLSPALESQLLAGVDPQVDLNLTVSLVSQLLAGVDPAITTGNVNLSPALVSQLLAGVDPTLSGPEITPALVTQLLAGVDPAVGGGEHSLAPGFDIARFYRHNISGAQRLVLVVGTPRSVAKGFRADESWDTVSGHFALPAEPRHPAAKQEAIGQVITAWTENKTASQATLTAAINAALTTAGYTRAQGAPIT